MQNLLTPEPTPAMPDAPTSQPPSQDQAGLSAFTQQPAMTQKGSPTMRKRSPLLLILTLVVIIAGAGTGVGMAKLQSKSGNLGGLGGGQPLKQVAGNNIKNGDVFGSPDEKTFKDSAEGYLEIGGVDGEGSHKLLRAGGETQTVYLTSSVTDLDKFAGMQVKVWGETFKAQKAGWLMDVGRVQVVETQAQPPQATE